MKENEILFFSARGAAVTSVTTGSSDGSGRCCVFLFFLSKFYVRFCGESCGTRSQLGAGYRLFHLSPSDS